MKLFLTVAFLVSSFACLNAESIEEIEQVLDNYKEKFTVYTDEQKPVWEKIEENLVAANKYFATLVEVAGEEVKNGNKDLETAKDELFEKLNDLSQEYTDEATPPYKAWQSAVQEAVTEIYEKITKLTPEEQEKIYNKFERVNSEVNKQFDSIFRPVNSIVRKNFAEGSELIKKLSY